jgi:hypothetical protein
MLKRKNNDYFMSKGITDEGKIFFLQQWLELFESRTVDTYQYSISNTITGLKELYEVIDKTMKGKFTTCSNVEAVREETFRLVKEDFILQEFFGPLMNRLMHHLGKQITKDKDEKGNNASLLRAKCELTYALNILEQNYFNKVTEKLKLSIINNEQTQIYKLTRVLASYAIGLGWTPKGLSSLIESSVISKGADDFYDNWSKFIGILPRDDEHSVYISITLNTVNAEEQIKLFDSIKSLGISTIDYDEIIKMYATIDKSKLSIIKEKQHIWFKVQAKDVYAAARKAIQMLNSKITVLAFYNKISAWSLNDIDGISIAENRKYIKPFKTTDIYKANMNFESENKVFENVITLFRDDNFIKSSTGNALIRVYNYTNISSVSIFPEERFMNLWIALESFMSTGQYSNIISHIKEVLPAIMSKRYIYRIVRNFAEDCDRCGVSLNFESTSVRVNAFVDSKKEMAERMIQLIRNEDSYKDLEQRCSINSLLKFRLAEVAEILKDNKTVITKLRRYNETVSWHIQRLYRIRNEIAHSALQEDNNIVILTEHLYDYLAVLISEIVYSYTEFRLDNIDIIFPYLKDNYDSFDNVLGPGPNGGILSVQDYILKDGIINYISKVD